MPIETTYRYAVGIDQLGTDEIAHHIFREPRIPAILNPVTWQSADWLELRCCDTKTLKPAHTWRGLAHGANGCQL